MDLEPDVDLTDDYEEELDPGDDLPNGEEQDHDPNPDPEDRQICLGKDGAGCDETLIWDSGKAWHPYDLRMAMIEGEEEERDLAWMRSHLR